MFKALTIHHFTEIKSRLKTPVVINMAWSMFGMVLPMLVAVVTIPYLIEALGVARFGVLSLAWVVVGYFSLFDMGLGKAMTQLVAKKIGAGEENDIPSLVWIGMALMTILGVLSAGLLWSIAPWLVGGKLAIPESMRDETLAVFYLLAISIPIVIITTGLRGILEGRQRFDVVNIVRAPLGALTYLSPMAVLPYSNSLPTMVAALVAARIVSGIVYLGVCLYLYPELTRRPPYRRDLAKQLLNFGGWMTLSNIVGPLLLYLGRLLLIVLVSAEAVAYFSTPYDIVINLLIIPGVFVSVMFPIFAQNFFTAIKRVRRLYNQSMFYIFVAMAPLTLITYVLAEPAIAWWINAEFAQNSYRVAQLIAIGIFINSFGHLSQALIQAGGRPDLTAFLHVAELVIYLPYLWWLIQYNGVEGAALAWVVRVAISTIALGYIANWCLSNSIPNEIKKEQ